MFNDITGYPAGGPTPFRVTDGAISAPIDTHGATAVRIQWDNPGGAGTLLTIYGSGGPGAANTFIIRQPQAAYVASTPLLLDTTGKKQIQIDCTLATSTTGTCTGILTFIYSPLDRAMTDYELIPKREPNVFVYGNATAAGNTVIWAPNALRRFVLMNYRIVVVGTSTMAVAGDLGIRLYDGAATITPFGTYVTVPALAGALPVLCDTGWIYLGRNGYPSTTLGNSCRANLSAALLTGSARIFLAGVEI